MTLVVRESHSRADERAFIAFPYTLYDATRFPNWVAPLRMTVEDALDRARNPFYRDADRALFLAERDGVVVGRIAAIENRAANRFRSDRTGFFGFFECHDDVETARALFDAAGTWLRARGLTEMLGPVNPSTNYECGLLVHGFDQRPTFMTPWNPPYYDPLCHAAGLTKAKDLLSFWFAVDAPDFAPPELVARHAARATRGATLTFRDLDLRDFEREAALLWELYNAAWEDNWGFVPMTQAEFLHSAKGLRALLRPAWSFVASIDGAPVGFMLAVPDYNEVLRHHRSGRLFPFAVPHMLWHKNRARSARVLALGVRREARARSLLPLFTHEIMRRGRAINGTGAEASWLLEDNHLIVKPMRAMGATERMTWRLYSRPLSPTA